MRFLLVKQSVGGIPLIPILLFFSLQIVDLSSARRPSKSSNEEGNPQSADQIGNSMALIGSSQNQPEDPSTSSVRVHLVKNKDFSKWRRAQGPEAILTRHPSGSVLLLLNRVPRQTDPGTGGGGGGGDGNGGGNTEKPAVVTPVLPINGAKKYNDTDCMPWEEVAVLLRSSMLPKFKRQYIDPRSCNLNTGLECLPFEEKGSLVYRCRCMLVYGPKAVYTNYTDNTGRRKVKCFLPAGLGWESECLSKSWSNYGFPLPFGDPSGTNAEQAAQTDAFNRPDGEQIVVEYIRWNSIKPECVPNAECKERGTYIGQRCQCKKGSVLERPRGTCNFGNKIIPFELIQIIGLALVIGMTQL